MQSYDDFIDYDGKKYGLPKYLNNIHYENNCGGEIYKTVCYKCLNYKTIIHCVKCKLTVIISIKIFLISKNDFRTFI